MTAVGADADKSCRLGQIPAVDGRVSLQSRRSLRSAKYQLPSIFANVSRYRSEATMILRDLAGYAASYGLDGARRGGEMLIDER